MMKRNFSILALLLTISTRPLLAQFSVEEYLSASVNDLEIKEVAYQLDFVDQHDFRSPLLREVEFRIRTIDLGTSPEDYRLRFSPINPYERKANREYRDVLETQLQSQQLASVSKVLRKRYQHLINHLLLSSREIQFRNMVAFFDELRRIESNQQTSIKDLIRIDRDLMKLKLDLEQTKTKKEQLELRIKFSYPFSGNIDWNFQSLVSINQIEQIILGDTGNIVLKNAYVNNAEQEKVLEQQVYAVNKAESFSNIGFVQAEYNTERGDDFADHMALRIGVVIPVTNPDRPDLERREMRQIENDKEIEKRIREAELALLLGRNEIRSLLDQYQLVYEKLERYNNFDMLNQSLSDMDVLLDVEKYRNELTMELENLRSGLLLEYIAFLDYQGKLVTYPLTNYLSSEMVEFDLN